MSGCTAHTRGGRCAAQCRMAGAALSGRGIFLSQNGTCARRICFIARPSSPKTQNAASETTAAMRLPRPAPPFYCRIAVAQGVVSAAAGPQFRSTMGPICMLQRWDTPIPETTSPRRAHAERRARFRAARRSAPAVAQRTGGGLLSFPPPLLFKLAFLDSCVPGSPAEGQGKTSGVPREQIPPQKSA